MPAWPFVSVIVPVYNDFEGLRGCLDALEAQSYVRDRYEVVVVDNGSSPAIGDSLVQFCHVRVEVESQRGSYAARNRGIEVSRGDVLAFTDADCRPAVDWLAAGVAALEADPNCGLVAGAVRVTAKDPSAPTMVEHHDMLFGFPQERYVEAGFGATANVFTRRDVIARVGHFRPELQSGGDREWGQRVRDAGFGLLYVDEARVDHPARSSWRELVRKTTRTNRGMFELAKLQGKGHLHSLRMIISDLRPPLGWAVRLLRRREAVGLRATLSAIVVLVFNRWLRAWVWMCLEARSFGRRARGGRTGL